MAVSVHYSKGRVTHARYLRAEKNLKALLRELSAEEQTLLNKIGVTFLLDEDAKIHGKSDYLRHTIYANVKIFSQFDYEKNRASYNQRCALSTLREEVRHYLDTHLQFTANAEWVSSVKMEMKSPNPEREALFSTQRKYDASERDQKKMSLAHYQDRQTIFERIISLGSVSPVIAAEWLVDLLAVRDYLQHTGQSDSLIETTLTRAFPLTYGLALTFENQLAREASKAGAVDNSNPVLCR
jgi:hypothetical protein